MDFRRPPMPFNYLPPWGTTISEDTNTGNLMDLDSHFTVQSPPMQGPSTVTQDSFPFHPTVMEQYLYSSSMASDSSFPTQATEFLDPIEQYLTLSPTESYNNLPDLSVPAYDPQSYITISDLSFPLGRPSIPFSTPSMDRSQDHNGQYVAMPTIPFPEPSKNSQPVLMGWPGEGMMGVSHPNEGKGEKERRLEIFMVPSPEKEEGYSELIDSYGSDEVSVENSNDPSYRPSPVTSSPSNGPYSPFFYNVDNSPSSSTTLNEESLQGSPLVDGNSNRRTNGSRREGKGKAKGSAALALAKLTLKNNKPLTGPHGTFVPYPPELIQGSEANTCGGDGTSAGVRLGRKRRNGHIPPPVIVPDLIKKSRGRKVPSRRGRQAGTSSDDGRPFVCEIEECKSTFRRNEHLKRHKRSIHTDEKEYICPEPSCGKAFNRRDNLAQHSRIHLTDMDS